MIEVKTMILALKCFFLLAIAATAGFGQNVQTIDGVFSDWTDEQKVAVDSSGDAIGGFDVTQVFATAFGTRLYLSFDIGSEINLQSGDAGDGTLVLEVRSPKASLGLNLRERYAIEFGKTGRVVGWKELQFCCLPTCAASRYELSLDLATAGFQVGQEITLNFSGSDQLDEPVTMVLADRQRPYHEIKIGRAEGASFRIANLNTMKNGLTDKARWDSMERLMSAVNADIYSFQEEWDHLLFKIGLVAVIGGQMNTCWNGGCAIASRHPLAGIPMKLDRAAAALVEYSPGKHVVVISVHFKCCGFAGSKEDDLRVQQAEQIAGEVGKMRRGEYGPEVQNAPLVIMGDFNLVGSTRPLEVLKRIGLSDYLIRAPGDGAAHTWRGLGFDTSFWPGRLDYVTHSEQLKPQNGFVLDTGKLTESQLSESRLQAEDCEASDHFMLVVDF